MNLLFVLLGSIVAAIIVIFGSSYLLSNWLWVKLGYRDRMEEEHRRMEERKRRIQSQIDELNHYVEQSPQRQKEYEKMQRSLQRLLDADRKQG